MGGGVLAALTIDENGPGSEKSQRDHIIPPQDCPLFPITQIKHMCPDAGQSYRQNCRRIRKCGATPSKDRAVPSNAESGCTTPDPIALLPDNAPLER